MPVGTRPFEFNRLEGHGYANPQASLISDTEWRDGTGDVNYVLSNDPAPTVDDIEVGDVFYTEDNDGIDSNELYSGGSKWYTIRTALNTSSVIAINIDNDGEVTAVNTTAPSDVLSVSGSIPYVNYYVRYDTNSQAIIGVDMYKTGSEDWHSIEGAVQVSNSSIGNSMSASNFNEFISASVAEYFDFSITGVITDSSNQISSSHQFQGYPKYEQSYIQADGTECWTDLGQDSYLIKWSYDTDHNGGDKLVTLTGLAPDTTGNATYDGTYDWISDINYVGEGAIDHAGHVENETSSTTTVLAGTYAHDDFLLSFTNEPRSTWWGRRQSNTGETGSAQGIHDLIESPCGCVSIGADQGPIQGSSWQDPS